METIDLNLKRIDADVSDVHFFSLGMHFQSLDEIIQREEFANKVIVVDIWGTWCGPCREEFQYLPDIKTKLKGRAVKYLYLANEKTKEPEEHWKETAKFYNLTGDHYLLNKTVLDDFWNTVDPNSPMRSYPTYMIIGKDGRVKIPKASLPSEGDGLYREIIEVLNER
jgi:thiol-disulfide isomerase/thioredoxin